MFMWRHGGRDVKIAGDFTSWHPIDMFYSDFVWKSEQRLDYGLHRFKFIVDGSWVCDDEMTKDVQNGIWNNTILVTPKSPMRRIRSQ